MALPIGPYTLPNPWILAPMAGVSEMPFRLIAREMGAGAAPTELVSAKGLLYGQERTARYLTHSEAEEPFWVQIFGGEPEAMARGAERAVELGARILDVNMGCPVKKVTKNGAGSALMQDPERAATIVSAMRAAAGVPVTIKIRSGWDANQLNCVEVTRACAEAGAVAVAMHARTRQQAYSGDADWSMIRQLVEVSPIPVIGNGDVFTPDDARRMLDETGCAAVMIGRGALGNPWIFSQLEHDTEPPTPLERWELVHRHLRDHIAFMGDELRAVRKFRPHLAWYAHGLYGASKFRAQVMTLDDLDELLKVCEVFFSRAERAAGTHARDQVTAAALG